jgi:coenzyme Q-binding protein COQ10
MRSLLRSQILRNLNRQCDNTACIAPVNAQRLITHRYSTSTSLSTKTRAWPPRPSQQNQPAASRRSFINLANILQNANNNNGNNNNNQEIRTLRATRTLPFPPSPLYEIISSVESYAEFLPFLAASTVTARDPQSGYPSQAFLTVGYGPFKETFTSRVTCDRSQWVVEARSGGGVGDDGRPVPGGDEGLFNHLSTKWQLVPETQQQNVGDQVTTQVQLEIRFRFQNAMHTAMMGAVEDKVAAVMIEAFERRIKEEMVRKL